MSKAEKKEKKIKKEQSTRVKGTQVVETVSTDKSPVSPRPSSETGRYCMSIDINFFHHFGY